MVTSGEMIFLGPAQRSKVTDIQIAASWEYVIGQSQSASISLFSIAVFMPSNMFLCYVNMSCICCATFLVVRNLTSAYL